MSTNIVIILKIIFYFVRFSGIIAWFMDYFVKNQYINDTLSKSSNIQLEVENDNGFKRQHNRATRGASHRQKFGTIDQKK